MLRARFAGLVCETACSKTKNPQVMPEVSSQQTVPFQDESKHAKTRLTLNVCVN